MMMRRLRKFTIIFLHTIIVTFTRQGGLVFSELHTKDSNPGGVTKKTLHRSRKKPNGLQKNNDVLIEAQRSTNTFPFFTVRSLLKHRHLHLYKRIGSDSVNYTKIPTISA